MCDRLNSIQRGCVTGNQIGNSGVPLVRFARVSHDDPPRADLKHKIETVCRQCGDVILPGAAVNGARVIDCEWRFLCDECDEWKDHTKSTRDAT